MGTLDTTVSRYKAGIQKLVNKFFDLSDNTLTGTAAQFNAALSDNDFAMITDVVSAAAATHAATGKTTPVDADEIPLADSAATFGLKKLTWANLKATLKAYTDTLYVTSGGVLGTPSSGTLTNCTGLPASGVTGDLVYDLAAGESTMARLFANSTVTSPSGTERFAMFTARRTETITQVRTINSTAASGTTLARIAVYTVDASDNLTLVASTANDTALWGTAGTVYTKSFSASFTKTRGVRYAVGTLWVGSSSPTLVGNSTLSGSEAAIVPRLNGAITGLSDLSSNPTVGTFAANGASMPYAALLP